MAGISSTASMTPRAEAGAAPWAPRAPFRPHERLRPDAGAAGRRLASRTATRSASWSGSSAEPWVAAVERSGKQVWLRLDDDWIEARGAALEERRRRRRGLRRPRRRAALRRLLLGRQHDQGAPHRPPAQPRDRQRARRGADAGRRRRVEHRSLICDVGRSMGEAMAGVVAQRPRRRRARLRGRARRATTSSASATPTTSRPRRAQRRSATTAPRTRSRASRRSTTTRPTS